MPPGFFLLGETKGKLKTKIKKIKDQGLLGSKQNSVLISISDFQMKKRLHSEDQIHGGSGRALLSPQKYSRLYLCMVLASKAYAMCIF